MNKFFREPVNSITHLIGAILAVFALVVMLIKGISNDVSTKGLVSVIIFGVSMILLYTVSATYHSVISTDKVIKGFRRLDHSMIFILIAGSYAPFCLIGLGNRTGNIFFTVMVCVAIAGVIFKMCWFDCPRWLQTALYIAMGWSAVFVIKPLSLALSPAPVIWLVVGGVLYTIGGVLYGLKPKKLQFGAFGFHEIFHIFIILGSLSHFICVYTYFL
ncbi:hemolysin III family protein [Clostridium gasigenes]|uniref:PAQR family membrane homeostasis protein TrhA n=1 Tax=Clostridium gasigenes TaxID=94869 RepID=UPI0016266296|nr:hemolysin III family protein [Clostridium gasigenes]MBB6623783.1 hemolysin III family protein [Clostridium gasigenes]